MKYYQWALAVIGVAAVPGMALAEMISGTVSGIDPQAKTMTLVRHDSQNPMTLSVKDQAQLLGLQPGNDVVVDANRKFFGGWKVSSVTMASGLSAGNEARLNAAANAGEPAVSGHPANAEAGNPNPQAANTDVNANPTADTTY